MWAIHISPRGWNVDEQTSHPCTQQPWVPLCPSYVTILTRTYYKKGKKIWLVCPAVRAAWLSQGGFKRGIDKSSVDRFFDFVITSGWGGFFLGAKKIQIKELFWVGYMETAYTSSLLPAGSFFDGIENHTTLVYWGTRGQFDIN